jgi:hypothetical protein
MMDPSQLQKALADLKAGVAQEVSRLPDHRQFVQGYAPAG